MTMTVDSSSSQSGDNNHPPDPTALQEECFKLLQSKQYKSCEILARMELSRAEQEGRDARLAWSLLGECAHATQQYNRAISYYRRIQYAFVSGVSAASQSSYANKYRLKEAQCLQALGNVVEASSVLERIPRPERNLTMKMLLGNLYLASGRNTNARECFFESLLLNPYAVEAIEWLAVLGAEKQTVLDAISTGLARTKNEADGHEDSSASSFMESAIEDLVAAHFANHRHQTALALQQFKKLERDFPNNVYLLLKIATLQVSTRSILEMSTDLDCNIWFVFFSCHPHRSIQFGSIFSLLFFSIK
jgi:tetratricopeptide (TPR) repeat protein